MRKLIVLFVLSIFVVSCASSIKQVKETPVLDEYKVKIDSLETEIEKKEKAAKVLKTQKESLESQKQSFVSEIDSLKNVLGDLKSRYEGLNSEKVKIEGRVRKLRQRYKNEIDQKQRQVFDLESRIDVLKKDMENKDNKIEEWNGLKKYYEKRIRKLKSGLEKAEWFRLMTYISFLAIFLLAVTLGIVLYKK